jgi:alkaline phosphatase D
MGCALNPGGQTEVTCIPESERGGYDLYNVVSSALARFIDVTADRPVDFVKRLASEKMIRPPIFGPSNFGVIDFDMTRETPELTFNVVDAYGRSLCNSVSLAAIELVNGVASWAEKI